MKVIARQIKVFLQQVKVFVQQIKMIAKYMNMIVQYVIEYPLTSPLPHNKKESEIPTLFYLLSFY